MVAMQPRNFTAYWQTERSDNGLLAAHVAARRMLGTEVRIAEDSFST
jgi:hypothetical protein